MQPRELPAVHTQCGAPDLLASLARAWVALFNETPAPAPIRILVAQSAFESGWWEHCLCWNLGGAKYPPKIELGSNGRCWFWSRAWEIEQGRKVWYEPPHRASCWLAYETLDEGAVDWLSLIRHRYAGAWPDLLEGDPAGYVEALKRQWYFTGDLDTYRSSVCQIYHGLERVPVPMPIPTPKAVALAAMPLDWSAMIRERDLGVQSSG